MNWDAIGAIAELLGAVGVIGSLVFLATQIRQSREQMSHNTVALRAAAYQQLLSDGLQVGGTQVLSVPGLDRVVRLGLADLGQLDEDDRFRFSLWINAVMHTHDNAHFQYRMGMMDDARWQTPLRDLQSLCDRPGAAQWWRATPPSLSPEFVALVDEILAEEPDRGE